jgi:hypothetical protein
MIDIGDMVVCVDARPPLPDLVYPLVEGCVYTVRAFTGTHFGFGPNGEALEEPAIALEEVENPEHEYGFFLRRFRPVKRTDISVFREALNPIKNKELEDV